MLKSSGHALLSGLASPGQRTSPAPVAALKDKIATADGLLLVTPKHNSSIPGVFKNTIDWLSRPPADIGRMFGGQPVAVIDASPTSFGTILSQNVWLPVRRTLGTEPWFGGRLMVSRARGVFDAAGALTDTMIEAELCKCRKDFVAFIASRAC